jgi:methionyl-tRNA synthetase
MGSFYVTTAIPYVNAEPHLGFALELVQADVQARYHRLTGDDTWFLTGTDENSLTNVLAAEREGLAVRALVDRNAEVFRTLTEALQISNDDFIRTSTDQRHLDGARRFWEACVRAGDVYQRSYRGLYCVRCERFYTAEELIAGRCPEHDIYPEVVEESNYFFRLSRYAHRLGELLDSRTLRVRPEFRHHEIQAFVAGGLTDFSISRTRARARGWGIPVPGDPEQVIYVWFDALTNYITALGYGTDADRYRRSWVENPRRVHVIGKDILRFHAVYWPAMLLSAGEPLPTTIIAHGFLSRDGRRMSKTLGTGVDPVALAASWGVDAVRYWLLREVPSMDDADYTEACFARAYGADLANDLGNLLQRTVSMVHRYRAGVVPTRPLASGSPLQAIADQLPAVLHRALDEDWDPREALKAVLSLVDAANRLVEDAKPWALAREAREDDTDSARRLDVVLYDLAECLRLVAEALRPLLPATATALARQLGVDLDSSWSRGLRWGGLAHGTRVETATPLFPRRQPGQAASGVGE